MKRLQSKVAIVTGGGRGIGKQIALTFAQEGADIVIGDITEMETAAKEIRATGQKVITVTTDVSNKLQARNLISTAIREFNRVDILVNNAGIIRNGPFLKLSEDEWDTVLDVNLKGTFLCTQECARYMTDKKYGKIINMASVAGTNVILAGQASYAASKAAIVQFTRICARELGPYGINVNVMAPGTVLSDLTYTRRTAEQVERGIQRNKNMVALGRLGEKQDISNLALFLASDESSYISGQVINADGGWFAGI
jgi:3-oxoacyl-[acyl-carrier protein] reductase